MTTVNPFDILGDDDTDDPMQLVASLKSKIAPPKNVQTPSNASAVPGQDVREERYDNFRGCAPDSGRGYVRGRGRNFVRRNREFFNNENLLENNNWFPKENKPNKVGDTTTHFENRGYGGARDGFSGGWSGEFSNEGLGESPHPQQTFERGSGSGQRNEYRSQGAGGGNWRDYSEEIKQDGGEFVIENTKNQISEKSVIVEETVDANKENTVILQLEKEVEPEEMTLEEYEKVVEEKRKAFESLKTEERRADVDKDFQSMHQLSNKKDTQDVFVKLGSVKEKRNEISGRGEKVKKAVSINEFLRPNERGRPYMGGGRGRGGRGRGRGGGNGINTGEEGDYVNPPPVAPSPSIADNVEFPSLR